MEQLKNIEMLTDKIRFKWMKQYRVILEYNAERQICILLSNQHFCLNMSFISNFPFDTMVSQNKGGFENEHRQNLCGKDCERITLDKSIAIKDSRALSFFQEWNPTPYFLQEENKG